MKQLEFKTRRGCVSQFFYVTLVRCLSWHWSHQKSGMQEVRKHTQDSQDSRRRDNRIKARSRAVPSPSAVEIPNKRSSISSLP